MAAGNATHAEDARDAPAPAHPCRPWQRNVSGSAVRQGLKILAAATGVGLLTGFFGVGGGFVIVPALVLALGFEMPVAVGTSLLVIAINSAAALAGALADNRVASRVDASRLTAAFTVLLIAVAAYSLIHSLPGLA